MAAEAWFSGITVSAAVLWGGSLAGAALAGAQSHDFDSVVTAVRDGGRTVCVERAEDSCGLRIDHPDHADALETGQQVRVTEIWLGSGDDAVLAFHVRSR